MSFTDPLYFVFLVGVFLLYYMLAAGWPRRLLLLASSYYFYFELCGGYILVLLLVTTITYYGALLLASPRTEKHRFAAFVFTITLVLIPLLAFKYLGALLAFGPAPPAHSWQAEFMTLALPIGISFFTFVALGYLADVYLGVVEPESDFGWVALFLAFFPVVSAGPIERAGRLMSQFELTSRFSAERALSALRIILIGLVLKMIFADILQKPCDIVFAAPGNWPPLVRLIGVIDFVFYLYADFAGYSLIAIGSARLLGLDVKPNFLQPFLSASVPEFWRNWHISLSSWVRDYIFTPMRMQWRRQGNVGMAAALLISFVVLGIWHGPKWGFLIFGFMHGILVTTSVFTLPKRDALWKSLAIPGALVYAVRVGLTFAFVLLTFVVFRAQTLADAMIIYRGLFSFDLLRNIYQFIAWTAFHHGTPPVLAGALYKPSALIPIIILGDILARKKMTLETFPVPFQAVLYAAAIIEILGAWMNLYVPQPFVYNKF
jgi:alginate O-acetyltransferase complex protein AlgI